jgi:flagellar basal-body rod protein FlgF
MQSNIYVGISAQLALDRRLETIAHNLANAATAGFRAEAVTFESAVSRSTDTPVSFVSPGTSYVSRRQGELTQTGNPLDVAISGDAWLSISTPSGQVFTRDGRMQMSPTGELQTLTGHPVLDVSGAPLQLDPNAGPPQIARDGMIWQGRRQTGALGLFRISDEANLSRSETSGVIPDRPAVPELDFNRTGVVQGHVERANINPVTEMTHLIAVQRAFEAVTVVLNDIDASMQSSLRILGGGTA